MKILKRIFMVCIVGILTLSCLFVVNDTVHDSIMSFLYAHEILEKEVGDFIEIPLPKVDVAYLKDLIARENRVIYAYYEVLDSEQKSLYEDICLAIENQEEKVPVNITINDEDMKFVLECVHFDHPEYFYLDTSYGTAIDSYGNVRELVIDYTDLVQDVSSHQSEIDANIEPILKEARKFDSEKKQAEYVHDAIIKMASYNSHASYDQTIYSTFVNHTTVCAGYAKAFQYAMHQLDIPCYYINGTYNGQPHAWDVVMIGLEYYNVDVTSDSFMVDTHMYFMVKDDVIKGTHERKPQSQHLPNCK